MRKSGPRHFDGVIYVLKFPLPQPNSIGHPQEMHIRVHVVISWSDLCQISDFTRCVLAEKALTHHPHPRTRNKERLSPFSTSIYIIRWPIWIWRSSRRGRCRRRWDQPQVQHPGGLGNPLQSNKLQVIGVHHALSEAVLPPHRFRDSTFNFLSQ